MSTPGDPRIEKREQEQSAHARDPTADARRPQRTHDTGGVAQDGSSQTAARDRVGISSTDRDRYGEDSGPQEGAPMRQHSERDESAADMTDDHEIHRQPMRRADDGAPAVVGQAHDDIERGLMDTDLYGSGNLGSVEDEGRRPDPPVERADDDVRRSGHDVDKAQKP